jgi:preprotein translocase subunit YajC
MACFFGRDSGLVRVFFFQITQHAIPKMTTSLAFLTILAQNAAPAAPAPSGQSGQQGGFPPVMLIGYVLLFAAMYFLMIAPQRKKQKEHQKLLASLDTGDEILTVGGIYGEITNKKDDRYVVRIADNTKIEIGKAFVQSVVKKANAAK